MLSFQGWLLSRSVLVSGKGKKAEATTAIWQLRGLGPAGPSRLNACRTLQACWLEKAKGQEMCSSRQPSVCLCSSLGRERGSRMKKAIALLYSLPRGEPGARLFVAWFGNSPCRHLLLAWEHAQAGEGRGWDHCLCLRFCRSTAFKRVDRQSCGIQWYRLCPAAVGCGLWPWPLWRGLCQHKHLNLL